MSSDIEVNSAIKSITALGTPPWKTLDPFLFCVHHLDHYPKGNEKMQIETDLSGRHLGSDFSNKDGFNMYHGTKVPGFPAHPHRGFETITIARRGFIDHSDSLGARARFGNGDIQWMTAGKGIVHSEMFPLLNKKDENKAELFQIWLNLPQKRKMVEPYFSMYWAENISSETIENKNGLGLTKIKVIHGKYNQVSGVTPPPDSFACQQNSDLSILTIEMQSGSKFTLPPAQKNSNRMLYFFVGEKLTINEQAISSYSSIEIQDLAQITLESSDTCELLYLQAQPINEPVFQHGPFVMNSQTEILQAMHDYEKTQFGGWPWPSADPIHGKQSGRFAQHSDGHIEKPPNERK